MKKSGPKPRRRPLNKTPAKPLRLHDDIIEKRFHIFAITTLLVIGTYQVVTLYQYRTVPNRDFFEFIETGKQLLQFHAPANFKRAPLICVLPVAIGDFLGGYLHDLRGFWMLNSIVHPLNLVLLYLVSKRLIGPVAMLFAIIVSVNPFQTEMLIEALAETTFIFFILLSLYLMQKRSSWCYLAASLCAIVRYEGAVLIPIAFLLDLLYAASNRQKIKALLFSILAALPLGIWLLATYFNWQSGRSSHYIGQYGKGTIFTKFIYYLWHTTLQNTFFIKNSELNSALHKVTQFAGAASLIAAHVYAIIKKNKDALPLMLFFASYLILHSLKSATIERYTVPIAWLAILFVWYGFQNFGTTLLEKIKPGKKLVLSLCIILICLCVADIGSLVPFFNLYSSHSEVAPKLFYSAAASMILFLAANIIRYRSKHLLKHITITVFALMMLNCNHFCFAVYIQNGQQRIEYKFLADWFNKYVGPNKILAVSYDPQTTAYFAKHDADKIISLSGTDIDTPKEFHQHCREKNIDYVAWVYSWRVLQKGSGHYAAKVLNITSINDIYKPVDAEYFLTEAQIMVDRLHFINIYKVK